MKKDYYYTDAGKKVLCQIIMSNEYLKERVFKEFQVLGLSNGQMDMIKVMSAMEKEWKKRGICLGVPIAEYIPDNGRKFKIDAVFSNKMKFIFEYDGSPHQKELDDRKDRYLRSLGYTVIRIRAASLEMTENPHVIVTPDNRFPKKKQKELMLYINSMFGLDYIDYKKVLSNVPNDRKEFWITYNIENSNESVDQIFNLISNVSNLAYKLQTY